MTAIRSGWLMDETDDVYTGNVAQIEIRRKSTDRVAGITAGLALAGAAADLVAYPPALAY